MVAFSKFAFAATLAVGAIASPIGDALSPLTVFHDLLNIPNQWVSHGRANVQKANIKAQIGLKQKNIAGLQAKLMDISNPDSENYGNWLSQEEIDAFTAPSEESVAAVKEWLKANGITEVSQPTNDWIEFSASVEKMEKLLDAQYEWFSFKDLGVKNAIPRTQKYSVPKNLHNIIDLVTPTTAFYTNTQPASRTPTTEEKEGSLNRRAVCNTNAIVPSCINQLYNVDYTSKGQVLTASTGMIGIPASHSDFKTFGSKYSPGLKDFQDVSVGGGKNAGQGSDDDLLEGNLDSQYVGGLSNPNPTQFIAVGPAAKNTDFGDEVANFASYLTSSSNPPYSVSTSYGGEEQGFDNTYLTRVCNEFMKAGSRGISVFFSSGDYGVGGNGGYTCKNGFTATWPAACPWITSVGGTQFNGNDEVVADFKPTLTSPGGGYSYHFDAPDYNKADTTAYAATQSAAQKKQFRADGRGYPDIALVSLNYQTIINGKQESIRGTSAATPAWAALIGVINDYRKSQGKPYLGFLNPLLYSAQGKAALRDVTSGNNYGCGSNGFYAAKGWDPASGLGSMDFSKLRNLS